jgi:hypothetical protein
LSISTPLACPWTSQATGTDLSLSLKKNKRKNKQRTSRPFQSCTLSHSPSRPGQLSSLIVWYDRTSVLETMLIAKGSTNQELVWTMISINNNSVCMHACLLAPRSVRTCVLFRGREVDHTCPIIHARWLSPVGMPGR